MAKLRTVNDGHDIDCGQRQIMVRTRVLIQSYVDNVTVMMGDSLIIIFTI